MPVSFNHIKEFEIATGNAVTIVLLNAHKIPPHLGLIHQNKWYSVSAKTVDNGINTQLIMELINKKKIPTLFIETQVEIKQDKLHVVFSQYSGLNGELTCLSPIRQLFCENFGDERIMKCKYIFELAGVLKNKDLIAQVSHLYLNDYLLNGSFTLKEYSMDDIKMCIDLIKNNVNA